VRLGGRNVYGSRVEERPVLGGGRVPAAADVGRSVRLSRAVWLTAAVVACAARLGRGPAPRAVHDP
jgi:adenosylcobinamide-phosphate synthase